MASSAMRQALERAVKNGWTVERTRSGHFRLRHPLANYSYVTSSTPSDNRAIDNLEAGLARALRDGEAARAISANGLPTPEPKAPPKTAPVAVAEVSAPAPLPDVTPPDRMALLMAERSRDDALAELRLERKKTAQLERELKALDGLKAAMFKLTGQTFVATQQPAPITVPPPFVQQPYQPPRQTREPIKWADWPMGTKPSKAAKSVKADKPIKVANFAEWMLRERREKGWSQTKLAAEINIRGVEQSLISAWERGASSPNPERKQRAIEVLGNAATERRLWARKHARMLMRKGATRVNGSAHG